MLYFTKHFDNATFYRYLPWFYINRFWFVNSIRNEWGEGSSPEGGVQHQQESVRTGWRAGGASRTPISRPIQEHPPNSSSPRFHWLVFVVIGDEIPFFCEKCWFSRIWKSKCSLKSQDQLDPYWFDLQTEVFFYPAYCISMIILLLHHTCSMLLSKTSHDETGQLKPDTNLIRPWEVIQWRRNHSTIEKLLFCLYENA